MPQPHERRQSDQELAEVRLRQEYQDRALEDVKKDLKEGFKEMKKDLEENYVTKDENDPVKRIVYGVVTLILVGVIGALLALVIK